MFTPVRNLIKERICFSCKEPAFPKCYSEAGKREFYISGLCEECFDECTKSEDLYTKLNTV
jgi:hypothetical protein